MGRPFLRRVSQRSKQSRSFVVSPYFSLENTYYEVHSFALYYDSVCTKQLLSYQMCKVLTNGSELDIDYQLYLPDRLASFW